MSTVTNTLTSGETSSFSLQTTGHPRKAQLPAPPPPLGVCVQQEGPGRRLNPSTALRSLYPHPWILQGNKKKTKNNLFSCFPKWRALTSTKVTKQKQNTGAGWARWLTPVVPTFWEAKVGGLPELQEFKTSLANMARPHLYKK